MILAVFSIYFGFITKDMFIGLGSGFFSDNALFIHPSHEIMLDTEFGVPTLFKLLPLIFTVSLIVIVIVLSEYLSTALIYFKLSRVGYNIFSFFNQRFLIELFYNKYITGNILKLGGQTTKEMDKGSVEYLGPHGLAILLYNASYTISLLNIGTITNYALYIVSGLILYLSISYTQFNMYLLLGLSHLLIIKSYELLNGKNGIMQSSFNPGSNNNNNPDSNNNNNPTNNNDSDVEMEDYSESSESISNQPETPRAIRDRNERDLEEVERLQSENQRLRDLFGTAEKVRDDEYISEDEYGRYINANQPSLNHIERDIRRNEDRIDWLENKMVDRRRSDYVLSEDGESESSQSSNSRPQSPDASNNNGQLSYDPDNYNGSGSPDSSNYNGSVSSDSSNNNGSSFSDTRSPRDIDNGCRIDTGSPLDFDYNIGFKFDFNTYDNTDPGYIDFIYDNTDPVYIDFIYDNTDPLNIDFFSDSSEGVYKTTFIESLCSALSNREDLFIEVPLISMLGLTYRLYKLGFFNALTCLYKLSFFHALMCSLTLF